MTIKQVFHLGTAVFAILATPLMLTLPAQALSMKECSIKYKAAQASGDAAGMSWSDFRKAECSAKAAEDTAEDAADPVTKDAKAAAKADSKPEKQPKKTEAESKALSGKTTFPSSTAAKFSTETPAKARMHTCLEQYHANKDRGTLGGMRWIEKGGGYFSLCNAKLKGEG